MKKYVLPLISVLVLSLMTLSLKAQCNLSAGFTATPDSVGSMNYTLIGNWQGGNPTFTYFTVNPGPNLYSSNTTYTFPAGGSYTVCFFVTDTLSNPACTASFCDTITVGTSGSCGSYLYVTNNGGGNYTMTATTNAPSNWTVSYAWDFGDGTTSTSNPVNHSYLTNATYTISVFTTATDPANPTNTCSGTSYLSVTVQGVPNGGGSMSCQANFNSSYSGNIFSFSNSSYSSDSSAASSSVWTIDGLQFSTLTNPTYSVSDSLMHIVCLTQQFISLVDSCYSTFCDSVGLGGNTGGGGGGSNNCQAGFVLWQDTLNLSTYYGYNTSVGSSGMTYLWDFGDGTTSTNANPTHQYANPGIYTICLTVADVNCTSTYCDSAGVYKMMNPGMSQLIILPNATGVAEISNTFSVAVNPNPLTEESFVSIQLNQATQLNLTITDILGRTILNYSEEFPKGKSIFPLSQSELNNGIYFLSVYQPQGLRKTIRISK